jgi:hypothetical protein
VSVKRNKKFHLKKQFKVLLYFEMNISKCSYMIRKQHTTPSLKPVLEIGRGQRIFWPIGQWPSAKISGQNAIGNWPQPKDFLADLADWPMAKPAKPAKIGRFLDFFIIITIISFFFYELELF